MWIVGSTVIVSLIAFIGVVTLSVKKNMLEKILHLLVALSAGALIGGAFLHLMPESIRNCSDQSLDMMFSFVILGFVIFFILEKILHWRHCHDADCEVHTFGYMNLIGDAIHNFIDGLIVAVSFVTDVNLGVMTTIAIAAHEIPQEIGDFGVLVHSGMDVSKALLLNFVVALTVIIGGLVGYFVSGTIDEFLIFLLPMAAGGFIYISSSDLIPELRKIKDFKKSILTFVIFLVGIALMWLVKFI